MSGTEGTTADRRPPCPEPHRLTREANAREAPAAMATQCTICERPVAPRSENPTYPLCSERCRLVDLGKWLGGDYAIPGPAATDYGPTTFQDEDEP